MTHHPVKIVRLAHEHLTFRRSAYDQDAPSRPAGDTSEQPPFILVLEPSHTLRTIIDVTLRRAPFPLGWALYDDAVAALQDIHAGVLSVPDLALIEQHLPRLRGVEAVGLLRARGYPTTIVLLVNSSHPLVRLHARLAGANYVLVKPFKLQELEQIVFSIFPSTH